MGRLFRSLVIYFFIAACASIDKEHLPPPVDLLPPPYQLSMKADKQSIALYLDKLEKEDPSVANKWWVKYRRGLLWLGENNDIACENFRLLAQDSLFSLQKLALLRAYESCPISIISTLAPIDLVHIESWLAEPALDISLKEAERLGNIDAQISLRLDKSKLNRPLETRVRLVQEALALAKKSERQELLNQVTERLLALAPRFNPNPERNQWLSVAKDYKRVREFAKAREYFLRIVHDKKSNFQLRLVAYEDYRKTFKLERNDELHLKASQELVAWLIPQFKKSRRNRALIEAVYDSHIHLARTLWTLNKKPEGIRVLEKLEKLLKSDRQLGLAFWIRGRMEDEDNAHDKAIDWYARAMIEARTSAAFRAKVGWSMAWSLAKLTRYDDAIKVIQANVDATDSTFERSRFQYWMGRWYQKTNRPDEAKKVWQQVKSDDFIGYYGLLAYKELGDKLQPSLAQRSPTSVLTDDTRELRPYLNPEVALWLNSAGEADISKEYLDLAARKMQKSHVAEDVPWLQLFRLYAEAGEYQSLLDRLNQIDSNLREDILKKSPELVFPRPYFQIVSDASQKFGISLELIYSIMRQESAFSPRARSHADAFGLMQVLPELARATRADHGIKLTQDDDLYQPDVNIPIGASYLRRLRDRYRNQFILYVASYNASEKAIQGWMKNRYNGDPVEFIEDIPYEETRSYVRLVMRNFIFYTMLGGRGEPTPFPDEILQLAGTDYE